jgi:Xaa-Pro aminopeptidase
MKRVSGTLLAQALQSVFRADVETAGKTDAEIAAEVTAQIKAQGGEVKGVDVKRSADGQTTITLQAAGK